jgi:hypothetical protein
MMEKYALSDEEFTTTVAMMKAGPITAAELCAALEISKDRARYCLHVCGLPPERLFGPCGRPQHRYRLHPDHVARIAAREELQAHRRKFVGGGRLHTDRLRETTHAPMWPSGDPMHFDTDGMGRIDYRGPLPVRDPKWDMSTEEAA